MSESDARCARPNPLHIAVLLISLLAAWAGVNAVWGLTSASPTRVSSVMSNIAPLVYWLCGALTLLLLIAIGSVQRQEGRLVVPITMLIAYVLGVAGAEYAQNWIEPDGPVAHRLFFLGPAIPMIAVWLASPQHRKFHLLRIGDWSPKNRRWPMPVVILCVAAVATVGVRFAIDIGFLRGDWWPRPATIVALAAVNGFAEELLYRGLIFPALMIATGLRWGILLQALFFGFLHFGASESWFGSLAAAIVLVLLGSAFAYVAFKRHGLAWVAGAHALIDIAGLSLMAMFEI